jgi:hypothetical protein
MLSENGDDGTIAFTQLCKESMVVLSRSLIFSASPAERYGSYTLSDHHFSSILSSIEKVLKAKFPKHTNATSGVSPSLRYPAPPTVLFGEGTVEVQTPMHYVFGEDNGLFHPVLTTNDRSWYRSYYGSCGDVVDVESRNANGFAVNLAIMGTSDRQPETPDEVRIRMSKIEFRRRYF